MGTGQAVVCAAAGESCKESKCCTDGYHKCYLKDEHWAACNESCSSRMKWVTDKWVEQAEDVWKCTELMSDTDTTEGKMAQDICVKAGENCMLSKCCSDPQDRCYSKDKHWASCNHTCSINSKWEDGGWVDKGEEKVWNCTELVHDDAASKTSFCDMSGCTECQGEQCTYCREEKERDCCLADVCDELQGDELSSCQKENLQTCCEGKAGHCTSSA